MFHSEAVATSTLTLRLDTGVGRIGPAACRPVDAEDSLRAHQREDLRRRLLDMIIRNEQRRELKPH